MLITKTKTGKSARSATVPQHTFQKFRYFGTVYEIRRLRPNTYIKHCQPMVGELIEKIKHPYATMKNQPIWTLKIDNELVAVATSRKELITHPDFPKDLVKELIPEEKL